MCAKNRSSDWDLNQNSVVPPGLELFVDFYPALKRWAKFGCPSGAGFSETPKFSDFGNLNCSDKAELFLAT